MKRLYACALIVIVVFGLAWHTAHSMRQFSEQMQHLLTESEAALAAESLEELHQQLSDGILLCQNTREQMTPFIRIEDFIELESALRAAQGYLEQEAPEECLGELRRAAVQVEALGRLSARWI